CGSSPGAYQVLDASGKTLGDWCFTSKDLCDQALGTVGLGYVCIPGQGAYEGIPVRADTRRKVGDFYFANFASCTLAVRSARGALICGRSSGDAVTMAIYDSNSGVKVEDDTYNSLDACNQGLSSIPAQVRLPGPSPLPVPTDVVRVDGSGGPMEHVSVRDQDDISDCFAASGVQLVDAWRFSHGDTNYAFQGSALLAGAEANRLSGALELSKGGLIENVLKVIQAGGICNKNVVLDSLSASDQAKIIAILKKWRNFSARRGAAAWDQDRVIDANAADFNTVYSLVCAAHDPSVMPSFPDLRQILDSVDSPRLISSILRVPCDDPKNMLHPVVPSLQQEEVGEWELADITARLKALLPSADAQPVSVSLCSNVLYKNRDYDGVLQDGGNAADCEHHQALVTGRRALGRRTQFLLRNSWGTDCGAARKLWSCDGTGNVWIDADALSANVYEISYLGDKR
ncbi:MAG: hypothetical protein ACXWP1_08205, partial [Bdellovibrionota bacterium]